MLTKLYFCLFCPQKFETNDENVLKKHVINKHFDGSDQKIVKRWMNSVANYQTELNECLSSDPKCLPNSSMCQSATNYKQKLLKGCGFCDKIIDSFKLDLISSHKPKNVCICGGGKEQQKVVVYCQKCKHLFHYQCVEPTSYSGQEISLYICVRCKDKDFEISDLSCESKISQPIHVRHHFNYLPFVCNLCNESHFSEGFLKTHLRSEHNLTVNESQISKYYKLNSILRVERLVNQSMDKIYSRTPVTTDPAIQSSSAQKQFRDLSDSMPNKLIRTNEDNQSVDQRRSEQVIKRLTFESNGTTDVRNSALNQKQNQNSMTTHYRPQSTKLTTQITRAESPVLFNQTLADIPNKRKSSVSHQKGQKKKRGRPKKSPNQPKSGHQYNDSVRKIITPNSYVDSNPQTKTRLSKQSRLSRPNIRLSREQESALKNNKHKSNGNKTTQNITNGSDDSDWDERTELFDLTGPYAQNNVKAGPSGSKGTVAQNNRNKQNDNNISIEKMCSLKEVESQVFDSESEPEMLTNESNNDLRAHSYNQRSQISEQSEEPEHQIKSNSNTGVRNEQSNGFRSNLSDWLTQTKPKKFPYFPQIDDEVVYIPYGHRTYIDTVRSLRLYRQTNTNKYVNQHLNDILYAKVKSIEFEKHSNIRLVKLTLNLVENEVETNKCFTVKFHDIDNVIDFIILKQQFDNSFLRNWKIGDSFRAVVEDKWWFGSIHSFNPEEYNMKSHFQSLNIVWGNGSADNLSFWDLEPIISPLPQNRRTSVEVTDEDRKLFYVSQTEEWPASGKEIECRRIVRGLTQIMALSESKQLIETFRLSNKDFFEKVPYLLSLDLIRNRVQNMFYRRHSEIKYDIKFLESNACILDPNDRTGLVRNTRIVIKLCMKFIDELNATDIQHIHKKLMSDLEKDPNILLNIKYHACVRRDLNNSPKAPNPLVVDSMSRVFGRTETLRHMNLLTPSTSSQRINKMSVRVSNDEDIPVIDLFGSDEDTDEVPSDSAQHADEEVNPIRDNSAPDSSISVYKSSPKNIPKVISKPVVTVRAMPIEEPPPPPIETTNSNQFQCYFCIFCKKKLSDKREATDHYFKELNVDLKCIYCSQNKSFESIVQFLDHNSEHISKMNISLQTLKNKELWIKSMVQYMDSLPNLLAVQKKIDQKFGDRCNVCECLNVSTEDSQPLFHKTVFQNNRMSNKFSKTDFIQHLKQHLRYEPVFKCEICTKESSSDVFVSVGLDEVCQKHIENVHKIKSRSLSDIEPYFWSTKISEIDKLIKQSVINFIIICYKF